MNTASVPPGVFLRNSSCVAALLVQLFDYASTFQFERKCVWEHSMTTVKAIFLCSRYLGIVVQTVNAVLVFTKLYQAPTDLFLCRYWFTFMVGSVVVLGTFMHTIIMLRVYALHGKDYKVGILLAILLSGSDGLCIYTWCLCYSETLYDGLCNMEQMPHNLLHFGICVIVQESIVLILTLAKMNVVAQYSGIVGRVVRDGGGVFAFMLISALSLILPSVNAVRAASATFCMIWILSLVPIMTCRLIKGFLEFDVDNPATGSSESSGDVELTSFINIE